MKPRKLYPTARAVSHYYDVFVHQQRRLTLLVAAGLFLTICLLQSQLLLMPSALDLPSRLLYRLAFFIILPIRPFVAILLPPVHHHWPIAHLVVASLGAPFLWWLMASGGLRAHRSCMRWRAARRPSTAHVDTSRRQFLARTLGGTAGITLTSMGGYGAATEMHGLRIRRYHVPIRDLPKEFEGLRIVHVSDTHYGPFTGLRFLENVAERARQLEPDLVVFSGDYVHFTPLSIDSGIRVLSDYEGRLGSAAVMGNHEHWEGARACRQTFERVGLPLIDNRRMFLTPEGLSDRPIEGRSLCIAGVGDLWEDEVRFSDALRDVSTEMPRIVLSHNPETAEMVPPEERVDLMLCGHTHGGQVRLPLIGPLGGSSGRFGHKYVGGYCKGPYCPAIVSRGVGTAFLPVRFRVPPELGFITLQGI